MRGGTSCLTHFPFRITEELDVIVEFLWVLLETGTPAELVIEHSLPFLFLLLLQHVYVHQSRFLSARIRTWGPERQAGAATKPGQGLDTGIPKVPTKPCPSSSQLQYF